MMHENYHSPTSIRAGKRKGRKEGGGGGGGGGRGEQMEGRAAGGGERNSARGTELPPCMTRKGTVSD